MAEGWENGRDGWRRSLRREEANNDFQQFQVCMTSLGFT
jgi:hypothetical protein